MTTDLESPQALLPSAHRARWRVVIGELVKFGAISLPLRDKTWKDRAGRASFDATVLPVLVEMHGKLASAPETIELTPGVPTSVPRHTSISGLMQSITIARPLVCRLAIPLVRQSELYAGAIDPGLEELTVYFDGTFFAVRA